MKVFHLHPFFPGDPKVTSGQETSDRVSSQVMYPTLLSQLSHDRVDPRKSRLALSDKRLSSFLCKLKKKKKKKNKERQTFSRTNESHSRLPTWQVPRRSCPKGSARRLDCPASDRNSGSLSRRSKRIRATKAARATRAAEPPFLSGKPLDMN